MLARHTKRHLVAVALLLSIPPLAAACGDDSDGGGQQPTATAPPASTATSVATQTSLPTSTATVAATETVVATPTETPIGVPTGTATAIATPLPAAFSVHGSVLQLFVTGAEVGEEVELLDAAGDVLRTGTTDEQGTILFRNLEAGAGYRVGTGSGADRRLSEPARVTGMDDAPDASFFEAQEIGRGYGYLKTRDGTLLAVNVTLPGPIEDGPYPTVVEYSGYDPANPGSPEPSSAIANLLGYAVAGVNMRGTGCSGGSFYFFEPVQSTDGYDVVEAIAAQPWVKNNKVGLVGLSYPGISQLFVGQTRPPHLAAIAPLSVISDTYRGTLYPGGILNDGFAVEWALERNHDGQPGGQGWSQKRLDEGDEVCIANQELRGQNPDLLEEIRKNAFYTAAIGDPLAPATFVDRIDVPVFLAGAWQDEQVGGYFANMLGNFTGTDKLHFTMINGGHVDPLGPAIFGRWTEFLSFYVAQEIPRLSPTTALLVRGIGEQIFGVAGLEVEADRFTDAASFEDALARFESEPKVRVLFENGAGDPQQPGAPVPAFEMSFDEWPVPDLAPAIWYFAADGRLTTTPPAGQGADSFVYDPSDAQRTTCEPCGRQEDYWVALPPWDWRSPQPGTAVAYVGDPLAEDLVMVGSGSVDLWLKSTASDVDLQVTLSEIRPDGQEVYVQNGWLRASHRELDAQATVLRPVHTQVAQDAAPLPGGEYVEARVELFPFAHAFRAGSRVGVSVEAPGGSRPRWRFEALAADGEVINTIGRSAAWPSRVVLPVVPGAAAPTSLPPCPGLRLQPCRDYVARENIPG